MGVAQWVTPIFILVNLCIITDFFRYLSYVWLGGIKVMVVSISPYSPKQTKNNGNILMIKRKVVSWQQHTHPASHKNSALRVGLFVYGHG